MNSSLLTDDEQLTLLSDKELADLYRHTCKEVLTIAELLRGRGYSIRVGSYSGTYVPIDFRIVKEVEL